MPSFRHPSSVDFQRFSRVCPHEVPDLLRGAGQALPRPPAGGWLLEPVDKLSIIGCIGADRANGQARGGSIGFDFFDQVLHAGIFGKFPEDVNGTSPDCTALPCMGQSGHER